MEHVGYLPIRSGRKVTVQKANRDDLVTEIERLAAKAEPALAKAILQYLTAVKNGVDLQALADALASGNIDNVLRLLTDAGTGPAQAAITDAIQGAVWGGGVAEAVTLNNALGGVHFIFDKLNPRLIDWLKSYTYGLIRLADDGSKEAVIGAIRDQMVAGMTAGEGPATVARQIKSVIGLTDRQQAAVAAYRKELEVFHMKRSAKGYNLGGKIDRVNGHQVFKPNEDGDPKDGVLLRRLRDFGKDKQLIRAMETGKALTPDQIDKMTEAYARKYLAYRSRTIARTEALRATNYGVQDAWRQALETGKANESLVRRQWIVAHDERLCETCGAVPKMNPKRGVKFDQPFATGKGPVMLPPLHPNCRCSVYVRQWEPEQLS